MTVFLTRHHCKSDPHSAGGGGGAGVRVGAGHMIKSWIACRLPRLLDYHFIVVASRKAARVF